jgi:CrcB protein
MQWLAVALGGALGAMGRFGVNSLIYPIYEDRFPLATVVVNVVGSCLMGILYVLIIEKTVLSGEWRNILMVGFLGAFTTFSTFSLDALALWQNDQLILSAAYIMGSVLLCILATYIAITLTRLI